MYEKIKKNLDRGLTTPTTAKFGGGYLSLQISIIRTYHMYLLGQFMAIKYVK